MAVPAVGVVAQQDVGTFLAQDRGEPSRRFVGVGGDSAAATMVSAATTITTR
ncbi:hypothetical protein ABT308_38100 [Saccharopolyspora kobensis]